MLLQFSSAYHTGLRRNPGHALDPIVCPRGLKARARKMALPVPARTVLCMSTDRPGDDRHEIHESRPSAKEASNQCLRVCPVCVPSKSGSGMKKNAGSDCVCVCVIQLEK